MKFYFVYSAGGGAGDWGGINRIFTNNMPTYFKDNILIKFGDIFFNHRSSSSIIKKRLWNQISDAKSWLISNTSDESLRDFHGMIMDVGTTKIVSFITSHDADISNRQLIARFNRIMEEEGIIEKYCEIINNSEISNAVTFDIPELFKVRSNIGSVERNIFDDDNCRKELIDSCVNFANSIYHNTNRNPNNLMTIINIEWDRGDIEYYLSKLDYTPTKLAIGGAAFYRKTDMGEALAKLNSYLPLDQYQRVHFLGCGGLDKCAIIKEYVGNSSSFSADNTTPYNRGIDGSTSGSSQSCYYDYATGKLIRINPLTLDDILHKHRESEYIAHFSYEEMKEILHGILLHQSGQSSSYTYECRARLIIHNFDVYRHRNE